MISILEPIPLALFSFFLFSIGCPKNIYLKKFVIDLNPQGRGGNKIAGMAGIVASKSSVHYHRNWHYERERLGEGDDVLDHDTVSLRGFK
jgi:hypothetical protein